MARIFDTLCLKEDLAVKDWFTLIKPKKLTEVNYLQGLKMYCDFIEKSPTELLNEADSEAEAGILIKRRSIRRYLLSYIEHLDSTGNSPNTVKLRLAVIKSFYKRLDVELPNLPRNKRSLAPLEKNTEIPAREDIANVLKVSDLLERAIILVGVSSGLSSNEIRNLKVSDFRKGYDPETDVTLLKLCREKTNVSFITFLNCEATRAVLAYLDWRQGRVTNGQDPNRDRQLEKQRIFSEDGYLFVLSRIPDAWLKERHEEERKFKRNTFMEIYRSVSLRANMLAPKGDANLLRSHNLRRVFFSALINAGCSPDMVEGWMGHKLGGNKEAYMRADPEGQKKIYMAYMPYLTISKELNVTESPDYQNIKNENDILRAETARHVVERSELQELKSEIEKMKDTESIKADYIKYADFEEIREMIAVLKQEREAKSKLKDDA